MRGLLHAWRFMLVVPPVAPLMVWACVSVTVAGGLALGTGMVQGRDAMMPVIVLQLFAVSTGFAPYARRGHYDLLLTGGAGRVRAAIAQWAASVVPGVAAWLVLAATEAAVTRRVPEATSSGAIAAMAVVSTLPWAINAGLPRFSAAIGWVLVCATTVSLIPTAWHASGTRVDAWMWMWAAGSYLLFPIRMLDAGGETFLAFVPVVALAVAGMAAALWWLHRLDVPLESGQ